MSKAKFDELETKSKMKNIRDFYRDIYGFKKGYQLELNYECESNDNIKYCNIILY